VPRLAGVSIDERAGCLSEFLVSQPTAVRKLLAEHVDDGRGSCRVCAAGGQRGHLPLPCTIYTAARIAQATRPDARR
jgi:hypothetical protein